MAHLVLARPADMASVLVVDTKLDRAAQLARRVGGLADVQIAISYADARSVMEAAKPDFLVTNLRLGAFNGLHLVYAAAAAELTTRSIVYTDRPEPGFGADVRTAGAFYETHEHLLSALPTYITSELPPQDRRDVWRVVLDGSLPPDRIAGSHIASWFAH